MIIGADHIGRETMVNGLQELKEVYPESAENTRTTTSVHSEGCRRGFYCFPGKITNLKLFPAATHSLIVSPLKIHIKHISLS